MAATGCVAAVLVGDMNWVDKDTGDPVALLGGGWVDAWQQAGSPRAAAVTAGFSWRLDRCFICAASSQQLATLPSRMHTATPKVVDVAAGAVALVGKAGEGSLKGETFLKNGKLCPLPPSDHRGLLVELRANVRIP